MLLFIVFGCQKDNEITTPNVKLKARFKYTAGFLNVTFTNSIIISIYGEWPTYSRDFDSGNYSTKIASSHTYAEGSYVVTLVANESAISSTVSDIVEVSKIPNSVTAKFDYYLKDFVVAFINQTLFQGVDPTYGWDFGDGEISADSVSGHTFQDYGVYVVKLTATKLKRCSVFSGTIKVAAPVSSGGLITIDGSFY